MTFAILMIYFAGVARTVQILSVFATGGIAIGLTLLIGVWFNDDSDDAPDKETVIQLKKWIRRLFLGLTASVFVLVFVPSEKTLYMLAGADVAVQVADKTSPVLNKTLELIEQKLDEELKETGQEKREGAE